MRMKKTERKNEIASGLRGRSIQYAYTSQQNQSRQTGCIL